MVELKSCPFCGAPATLYEFECSPGKVAIGCSNHLCGYCIDWAMKDTAIEEWNWRAKVACGV